MKKIILWSSFALLLLVTTACSKQNETVLMLSAHTWVVASGSTSGVIGDVYKFYDNRLFFQSGSITDDGKWTLSGDATFIEVNSDMGGNFKFTIKKLTTNELELSRMGSSLVMKLAVKE